MRDHLEKVPVELLSQEDRELLEGPDFPHGFEYLWQWYTELSAGRGSGGMGPAPISYEGIEAWSRLTKRDVTPWEVDTIKMIDGLFLQHVASDQREKRKKRQKPSGREVS